MKTITKLLLTSLLFGSGLVFTTACSKNEPAASTPSAATGVRHPLQGVITDVHPDRSAVQVKHEDIPGFMPAMTMLFKVDAATLQAARKGDSITGTLVQREDGFWLEDMRPAAP